MSQPKINFPATPAEIDRQGLANIVEEGEEDIKPNGQQDAK
jgi:hypothetical protein